MISNLERKAWDKAAADYSTLPIPKWSEDAFLKMIDSKVAFNKTLSVLDIGCGSGVYSIALSNRVGRVTGIDLSDKMVACAREKASGSSCSNVEFIQGDFESMAFSDTYDLVLARLTPAISDQIAFEKMMQLSKGWCFYAKATRRTDAVLEEAKHIVGIEDDPQCDSSISKYFDLLWKAGKSPFVDHYHDIWPTPDTLEQSMWFYEQILHGEDLLNLQRAEMMKVVERIVKAGALKPRIEVDVTILGWQA